jgi:signal transduction histidine kinase
MTTWASGLETGRPPAASGNLGDPHRNLGAVEQAAHDLRQPIGAVLALASAALADKQAPQQLRRRLEQIVAEANWLSKITYDMLAEAGVPQDMQPVDIAALVRDAVNSEQLTYGQQIVLQQPDQAPRYVMAAATRLRRALANVLANATRAAGPDGHVQVTQRVQGSAEVVEVTDNGPGFGSAAAGNGIGIGLLITRRMLAECGGYLEVDRLSSGHTLVRLWLPIMIRSRTFGGGR